MVTLMRYDSTHLRNELRFLSTYLRQVKIEGIILLIPDINFRKQKTI